MKIKDFGEQVYKETIANPAVLATSTIPAAYIDVSDYERFVINIAYGASDGVFDAQVVQATAVAGTGSKDIVGAAITQLSATDDNTQVTIEVQSDQLDIVNGFRYVAVTFTAAGTSTVYAEFIGLNPRHVPVTQPVAYAERVQVAG